MKKKLDNTFAFDLSIRGRNRGSRLLDLAFFLGLGSEAKQYGCDDANDKNDDIDRVCETTFKTQPTGSNMDDQCRSDDGDNPVGQSGNHLVHAMTPGAKNKEDDI